MSIESNSEIRLTGSKELTSSTVPWSDYDRTTVELRYLAASRELSSLRIQALRDRHAFTNASVIAGVMTALAGLFFVLWLTGGCS